jgi:hypothetical protein
LFLDSFGFSPTQDNVSILYILAEVVGRAVELNLDSNLNDVCSVAGSRNYSAFQGPFKDLLTSLNATTADLDPFNWNDPAQTSPHASARATLWLSCNELGWFRTSGGLRPAIVNLAYFDRVCERLFGRPHADTSPMDAAYGSNRPASGNVFFVNGERDPWSPASVTDNNTWVDRRAAVVSGGSHCSDLTGDAADGGSLKSALDAVTSAAQNWTYFFRHPEPTCQNNGTDVLGQCKCVPGWSGSQCTVITHAQDHAKVLAVAAIVVSTILLLLVAASTWLWDKGDDDGGGRVWVKVEN